MFSPVADDQITRSHREGFSHTVKAFCDTDYLSGALKFKGLCWQASLLFLSPVPTCSLILSMYDFRLNQSAHRLDFSKA